MLYRVFNDTVQLTTGNATENMEFVKFIVNENVKRCCSELVKLGLAKLVVKEYMLTTRVYEAVKTQVEYTCDRVVQYIKAKEMVLEHLKSNGLIANAITRKLCGFTIQKARGTIDKMIGENLIKKVGASVATKYILDPLHY